MGTQGNAAQSVSQLDKGVSSRQAFGASYEKHKNHDYRFEAYWDGRLVLPPHPEWDGEPTDWLADPFHDKNWQFQHHTLRWLNPLRWAALDGDEQSRAEWVRIAKSWAEHHIPSREGLSPHAWQDMADGNRAIQLSLGAPLVEPGDDWFVRALEYHRDWLLDESHIVGKNHGLHQHSGLLVVGAVLRDREALDTAVARMSQQFKTTFDVQGANDEGSVAYHQMNIKWWDQAWKRARLEGFTPPPSIRDRLSLAATVLAHMSMPNGQLPQIGDAARGRVSRGLSAETDFLASSGKAGNPPESATLVLDRGYIFSRSGWGESQPLASESHMVVRHGKDLRSHSHHDRGSVHIYSEGQRWLVDSGFHSYRAAAPENKYLKSRASHNIAEIVGETYNLRADVELVRKDITRTYHDFTLLDQGYADHNMTRRVIYLVGPDCWIVSDRIHGGQNTPIMQRWHIEPGVAVRTVDNGFRLATGAKRFSMTWLGKNTRLRRHAADDASLDAWIGTSYRTLTPSVRVTAQSTSYRPHLVALLSPNSATPLGVVDSRVTATGVVEVHLVRGGNQWNIVVHDDGLRVVRI